MITITLKRNKPQGKAVTGTMTLPFEEKELTYPTLENRDFLIPAGTYPIELTWSPKFKKFLPEIKEVFMPDGTERIGIRMHRGTIPEHSTGCILLSMEALSNTIILFNRINNWYEDEKVQIKIIDPDTLGA